MQVSVSRIGATPVGSNILLVPFEPVVVVQRLQIVVFGIPEFLRRLDEVVFGFIGTVCAFRHVDWTAITMILGVAKTVISLELQ